MKIKTCELTGAALDWAVAKCEGLTPSLHKNQYGYWVMPNIDGSYSSEWRHGGPIIEREHIDLLAHFDYWEARLFANREVLQKVFPNVAVAMLRARRISNSFSEKGQTPLVAAMKCYVASKLGGWVEIPEELMGV